MGCRLSVGTQHGDGGGGTGQAPYNKIRHLSGIEAYVDLAESVGGKIWDSRIAEGLYQTENKLAQTIPMWHLECLPDEEAARLCHDTITR